MPEVKKDCNWYKSRPRPECGILSELVCRKTDKCSFCETKAAFKARQKAFEKKYGLRKQCRKCREFKSVTEFTSNIRNADGLDNYCRDCNREIMKKYLERKIGVKR